MGETREEEEDIKGSESQPSFVNPSIDIGWTLLLFFSCNGQNNVVYEITFF